MPALVQTHWAPLQQYSKLLPDWTVDQYHNKPNMDAGENTPQPYIAMEKIFCSTTNTLQKDPSKPG